MSEEADSRCMHCLEAIRKGARRCPHCRSWQSRWAADAQNPRIELLVLVLAVVAAVGLLAAWMHLSNERFQRGDAASAIEIVESRVVPQNGSLAVIGTVRNLTSVHWRNIYFNAECFDSDGELIDTFDIRSPYLVLTPDDEASFRGVYRQPLHVPSLYHRCSVEVRWADVVARSR